MQRLLPLLVLAQAGGILAVDASGLGLRSLLVGAGTVLALGAFLRAPRQRACAAVALAFAGGGCALGLRLELASAALPEPALEATVDAVVAQRQVSPLGVRVELRDAIRRPPGSAAIPSRIELRLAPHELDTEAGRARVGDRLRARLRLRALRAPANPGGTDRERALARRGITTRASLVHPSLVLRTRIRGARLAALRERTVERLLRAGPGGALLAALALGERSGLPEAASDAFSRLGVMHLLAVSGLHLALVAGLVHAVVSLLLRALPGSGARDRRPLALASAVLASVVYALATGLHPPVLRAAVVVVCLAGAHSLGRPRATGRALWLAAGIVLALDPAALFSLGAQLSFAATAALVAAVSTETARGGRIRAALRASLETSATAIAATSAILAAHGLPAAPIGLVANAVVVPWCAFVLLPASGLAAFCALVAGDASGARQVVDLLAELAASTLAALTCAAAVLDRLPLRLELGAAPGRLEICASALCGLWALRAKSTLGRVTAAVAATVVLGVAPSPRASPRFIAFDVGAGDALLVQGRSATLLVDGGFAQAGGVDLGRSTVVPALRALGVDRLDAIAATHADADHAGGLAAVLERVPVGELWLPAVSADDLGFAALRAAAGRRGVPVRRLAADWNSIAEPSHASGAGDGTLWLGDLRIDVLWPPADLPQRGRNGSSLVLRVHVAETRLLLTGDLDLWAERRLLRDRSTDLRAEILKVAHHGSASASGASFLAAVGADVAVVSAPCDRPALPAESVLERLRKSGAALGWTGRDGAIRVLPGPPLRVHGQRLRSACKTPSPATTLP